MTTITSNNLTVTVAGQPKYGLVCSGGIYRCVQGGGSLTLSQCTSDPNYSKSCG